MSDTPTPEQIEGGPPTSDALIGDYLHALTQAGFGDYPLAGRVVFRGPRMGPVKGADAVRPVLDQIAGLFQRFSVIEHDRFVDLEEAVLFVEIVLPDGRGFAIADHLHFTNGELVLVRPYFDAGLLEELGHAPTVAGLGPSARL